MPSLDLRVLVLERMQAQMQAQLGEMQAQLDSIRPVTTLWSPALSGSSGGSAHTYSVQWGELIQSGRHVTFGCTVRLSAKDATMGGTVVIAGLPIPVQTIASEAVLPFSVAWRDIDLAGNYIAVFAAFLGTGPGNVLTLYQSGKGLDWEYLPAAAITATSELAMSGSYWSD